MHTLFWNVFVILLGQVEQYYGVGRSAITNVISGTLPNMGHGTTGRYGVLGSCDSSAPQTNAQDYEMYINKYFTDN